ncbi:hypothetical protein ES703_108087 [subsurface metagenome]
MAAKVLGVRVSESSDFISGRQFREAGIGEAVESDFFDWFLAPDRNGLHRSLERRVLAAWGKEVLQPLRLLCDKTS